ncbi:GIY-YIG nuclease family protein [Aequorivita sp. F47161]|uniref:GIY-YIG nuclease family protein n=1 Tax=Aequorivita vitellina TaxID=2874475 RepID=A0A9X1QVP3_9FLAO|nr:GIY-YIG nuclease family protein [Aequorivita vitellina]MCG2420446.1 GIY-YIG nuclease family protein [Aequorivita vitellina]
MKVSHVYMMTNKNNTVLYTGVTSDLKRRVFQHKSKFYKGFTSTYNCDKLVYYKEFRYITDAIAFEKRIKSGSRRNKIRLVDEMNPEWEDLFERLNGG